MNCHGGKDSRAIRRSKTGTNAQESSWCSFVKPSLGGAAVDKANGRRIFPSVNLGVTMRLVTDYDCVFISKRIF